ncbi:amino acid aminotransferase [Litoreibacter roseus]|uniref:Aminotransferase n=1 Tax=Litoreibacter roseus TaxID=2601869 RepID=A0A6N6JF47_9RHOB|nr:amino acid aminotransferase [Litoreibacter roseus]GFE64983.1 aromatic amino acid aminotransferase [Litoreibacter roseus]
MFEALPQQPGDEIIALMQAFRADPRETKLDLGVGVYRDAHGNTPVMGAIKEAERRLWQSETTKTYVGLAGDPEFADAMRRLILNDAVSADHVTGAATTGGTAAFRAGLEMIQLAAPDAQIWISAPTWPNHPSIISYLNMPMSEYRYFDPETGGVDFDGMMTDLSNAAPGDVVLLHGCCHNPTGANLNASQWQDVAEIMRTKRLIPFIDLAYQGFGNGLDADAYGVRHLAKTMPEMIIAASCSKNFGVYRDRVGALLLVSQDTGVQGVARDTAAFLNRQAYSFPPDHGARLVTMVLNDPNLRAQWQAELSDIRDGLSLLRTELAHALRQRTGSDRFGFLAEHRGMFSRLGATRAQVDEMREVHGIYMVGDSRMNIAGLNTSTVPLLADAIVAAGV